MAATLPQLLLAISFLAMPSTAFVPDIVHPPHVHVRPKISNLQHKHSHNLDSRTGTRLLPPLMQASVPLAASSYNGDSSGDAAPDQRDHPFSADMAALAQGAQGAYLVHSHGGPVHVIDASVSEGEWVEDFKSKLRVCGNVIGLRFVFLAEVAMQRTNQTSPSTNKISLVTLAVGDTVWLIRTCQIKLPQVVRDVFMSKSVVKLVISFNEGTWRDVAGSLGVDLGFQPELHGFVGIDGLTRKCGMPDMGILSLAAHYGYNLAHRTVVRQSNWAAPKLSPNQLQSAADHVYFNLVVGRWLLGENDVVGKGPSAYESQAIESLMTLEGELLDALNVEDCTGLHASRMAFWARLREAVRDVCEATGQSAIPYAQLWELRDARGHYFRLIASRLGETMCARDVLAQSTHFAVNRARNKVRPRSDAERSPPSQEELNQPWATDPSEALKKWLGLQTIGDSLDNAELRGRLALLRELFVSNGDWAPANSIGALLQDRPNV